MFSLILVHLAGLASPGPDFFYVVRTAASKSFRAGFLASIGIALGICIWAGLAVFGFSILSFADRIFQYLIMFFGAIYLFYIGINLLKTDTSIEFDNILKEKEIFLYKEIKSGFLINISNAKAAIYFTSIVSSIVLKFPEFWQLFLIWLFFIFSTFLYFCAISVLFSRKIIRLAYCKYAKFIDKSSGIIFIFFAILLFYEVLKHFLG